MKKIMLVMSVLVIVAFAMTGCTERGDELTQEQAAVVAKALSATTSHSTSAAGTTLSGDRALCSGSVETVMGNMSTLDSSTVIFYNKGSYSVGVISGIQIGAQALFAFDEYSFTTYININENSDLETVLVTLNGNYEFLFDFKAGLSGISVSFSMGESSSAYNEINGLQMKLSGEDIRTEFGGDISTYINFKLKMSSSYTTASTSGVEEIDITGSINGNKITDDDLSTFDYSYFSDTDE